MSDEREPAQIEVQVTVSERYLADFSAVVDRLKAAGLRVDQRLDAIGVVTGRVAPNRLNDVKQTAGVADVEQSRSVGIPPDEQGD